MSTTTYVFSEELRNITIEALLSNMATVCIMLSDGKIQLHLEFCANTDMDKVCGYKMGMRIIKKLSHDEAKLL